MKKHDVVIELLEEALGTCPGDKEVYETFVASKSPDAATMEEEVAAFGADIVAEKGKTIFLKDEEGHPYILNYMLRGFFKSAAGACRNMTGTLSNKDSIKAHKKKVDNWVFVYPRIVYLTHADGSLLESSEIGNCQRPLRASTPQGERVSLASSEAISAGTRLAFSVYVGDESINKYIPEWLKYGQFNGLCQWRNSGKGAFRVISDIEEDVSFMDLPDDLQ